MTETSPQLFIQVCTAVQDTSMFLLLPIYTTFYYRYLHMHHGPKFCSIYYIYIYVDTVYIYIHTGPVTTFTNHKKNTTGQPFGPGHLDRCGRLHDEPCQFRMAWSWIDWIESSPVWAWKRREKDAEKAVQLGDFKTQSDLIVAFNTTIQYAHVLCNVYIYMYICI